MVAIRQDLAMQMKICHNKRKITVIQILEPTSCFTTLKADFPSFVGIIDDHVDKNDAMDGPEQIPQKKYLFDTPAIKAPRKNMNLQPILNNHGLSKKNFLIYCSSI